jgi:hypothetical protein
MDEPFDLDSWLAAPAVRTQHHREAGVSPAALWESARGVRLGDCRLLGRLVSMRIAVARSEMTFDELFRTRPFVTLEAGPTWALAGVCGRIWMVRGGLAPLSGAGAFRDWREPATARVLFAHWVEPLAAGARLHSEVRVDAVDRRGARYLRALEPLIGAFQGLVGRESLALAVRRAERAGQWT